MQEGPSLTTSLLTLVKCMSCKHPHCHSDEDSSGPRACICAYPNSNIPRRSCPGLSAAAAAAGLLAVPALLARAARAPRLWCCRPRSGCSSWTWSLGGSCRLGTCAVIVSITCLPSLCSRWLLFLDHVSSQLFCGCEFEMLPSCVVPG